MVHRSGTTPSSCNLCLLTRGFAPKYRHNSANLPPVGSNSLRGFTRPVRGIWGQTTASWGLSSKMAQIRVCSLHRTVTGWSSCICTYWSVCYPTWDTKDLEIPYLFIISLNKELFAGFSVSHSFALKPNDSLSYIKQSDQLKKMNILEVFAVGVAASKVSGRIYLYTT